MNAQHRTNTIVEWEHFFIPLADGTELAARAWLPESALPENAQPDLVPAILEYIPYRKRDGTKTRDEQMHPWWASHGYACVRVDMRGCGESTGLLEDEYLPQELNDGVEVINWLAQQPWCTGKVGMMGKSWGGFNCLQVAALQPAPLKAVLSVCSTDDRYADDIHYRGGALLTENFSWAATMTSYMAKAPDPVLLGEVWRQRWMERMEAMPLLAGIWLEHTYKDDYWQHGSINQDYTAVKAAVYCVGGWGDAYSVAIPRMMQGLLGPKKALIGPWAHKYPHFASPKPEIDFLTEAKRWWDYWLKDIDNGIMDEAPIAAYIQDAVPPQAHYAERPGKWVEGKEWPLQAQHISWNLVAQAQVFSLIISETAPVIPAQDSVELQSPLTTGAASGEYCVIWCGADFPTDQRLDDSYSVCFESQTLEQPLDLLGAPIIELDVCSDQDCGQLIVRLCDLAADGSSKRVSYGVLNLAMRDGLDNPKAVVPEETMRIRIQLDDTGYQFPVGHRIRVALSNAYFPLLWPSAKRHKLTLGLKDARFTMPIYSATGTLQRDLGEAYVPKVQAIQTLRPESQKRTTLTDAETGQVTTLIDDDFGEVCLLEYNLTVGQTCLERHSILPDDSTSARSECVWYTHQQREEWDLLTQVKLIVTCDQKHFFLQAELIAEESGTQVFYKQWDKIIDRLWV